MSTSDKADPEWDPHKATIESLYIKNNLKLQGPGGLMEVMAKSHGFVKSKAQYEWRLKSWDMRKNRTKDEWKSIGHKVAKRKRAGKDSDVYIDNEVIPKAKVQKQIMRHRSVPTFEQNIPALSPRTPEGFQVLTPVAEDLEHRSQSQNASLSLTNGMRTDGSPIYDLQDVSPPLPLGMGTNGTPLYQLQETSPSLALDAETQDHPLYPVLNVSPYLPFWTELDNSSLTNLFQPRRLAYEVPFLELEAILYPQDNFQLNAQISESEVSLGTSLPLDQQESSRVVFGAHHAVLKVSASLATQLKALLPSAAPARQAGELLIPSATNNYHSDSSSPRLLAAISFAIANNFACLDRLLKKEILVFLKAQSNTQILHQVLSTSEPESEAFAENLFLAAIESEDARIVETLLQTGLDPNDLVCTVNGKRYTPIERCSQLRNIELTKLLLRANADVNKTFQKRWGNSGALACAIDAEFIFHAHSEPYALFELVRMLLDAGGKFDLLVLEVFIDNYEEKLFIDNYDEKDSLSMLNLLIESCVKTKPLDLLRSEVAMAVTSRFDNETAARMVIRIFEAGADAVHGIDSESRRLQAGTLEIAAGCGNLALVQFLLRSGVQDAGTLTRAIKGRNKDLVRFLLDAAVDVVSLDDYGATPLSEAIRSGDAEIMEILEHKGAWSQIGEKSQFEAALIAASGVGELDIVRRLLAVGADTTADALVAALGAAVGEDQETVVALLLDAGTNVVPRTDRIEENALLTALVRRNAKIVRLILDAGLSFENSDLGSALAESVEWGKHSIIEELIAIGADPNGWKEKTFSLHEETALTISIRKKDTISMQLLLHAGADVNYGTHSNNLMTALWAAVASGDIEMVEHVLSIGADPDDSEALKAALPHGKLMIEKLLTAFIIRYPHGRFDYGCNALKTVIFKGDLNLVEFLLRAKIDVNTFIRGLNALGAAIAARHITSVAILQKLLSINGNPNSIVQDASYFPYPRTALLYAIDEGDFQKVRLLVDAGADVNWPTRRRIRRTPLQMAAEVGSFELAQFLIDKGGLVNAQPARIRGATALQLAAIGGYVGIAELLLDNGADLNAPPAEMDGRTALEGAAEHGRIGMLGVLANAGVNLRGPDYDRALGFAKEDGHMATWRYLQVLRKEFEVPIWNEMTAVSLEENVSIEACDPMW